MPLTIYRRHAQDCAHKPKGRRWNRCDCTIWVQGSLGGEYIRRSLDLTVWGAAQEKVRGWEASGKIGVEKHQIRAIKEAVEKFLEDGQARHLREETMRKHKTILESKLLPWCEKQALGRFECTAVT